MCEVKIGRAVGDDVSDQYFTVLCCQSPPTRAHGSRNESIQHVKRYVIECELGSQWFSSEPVQTAGSWCVSVLVQGIERTTWDRFS